MTVCDTPDPCRVHCFIPSPSRQIDKSRHLCCWSNHISDLVVEAPRRTCQHAISLEVTWRAINTTNHSEKILCDAHDYRTRRAPAKGPYIHSRPSTPFQRSNDVRLYNSWRTYAVYQPLNELSSVAPAPVVPAIASGAMNSRPNLHTCRVTYSASGLSTRIPPITDDRLTS